MRGGGPGRRQTSGLVRSPHPTHAHTRLVIAGAYTPPRKSIEDQITRDAAILPQRTKSEGADQPFFPGRHGGAWRQALERIKGLHTQERTG